MCRKCFSQGHNRMARVGFEPRPCWSRARRFNHSTTLPIPFTTSLKYLRVILHRSLTYRHHLENINAKTNARCNMPKILRGNSSGLGFHALQTSALALCFFAAKYCAPVWPHSKHTKLLNSSLNECMRLVTGCIRSGVGNVFFPVCQVCEIQCQNIRLRADVFTLISSPISLFFSQNQDVL